MHKDRASLSAAQVEALRERLDQRLDRVGLPTEPEVVRRILALTTDPDAGVADYARILKSDAAITGRLLKIANCAYFAQRQPVTSVDRACVVLGLTRVKALSLGVYLGSNAAIAGERELASKVWGRSLFRACVACELVGPKKPELAAEAFVVGLMVDSGVPIMPRLIGETYFALLGDEPNPTELFETETRTLEFTHADVLTALITRWRLPERLAKPMRQRHSAPPKGGVRNDDDLLRRAGFVAGAIRFVGDHAEISDPEKAAGDAVQVLGVHGDEIREMLDRAANEYSATSELFSDFADPIKNTAETAASAHNMLMQMVERALIDSDAPVTYQHEGMSIQFRRDELGRQVAVLMGSDSEPLVTYPFEPGYEKARTLLESLGFEYHEGEDYDELQAMLDSVAA
ncbi:MAG: HDOD domain-containing protein [Planctomycetota bacterium]